MNGYTNWETWHVASLIDNDELLYNISIEASDYADFLHRILDAAWLGSTTPDGVEWDSLEINHDELDVLIAENV
tara:strand:- start:445 stop:666 length:222 start_codon:yes stop_codon:yes gene_type:complete